MILDYFMSLDPLALLRAMPGTAAQGIIWGIMALGVYITFRILDFADLTVDGSLATGAAVAVMLIQGGMSPAPGACILRSCGNGGGTCDRYFPYASGDSGNPGKYPYPGFSLFSEPGYHGKIQSGNQSDTAGAGGVLTLCDPEMTECSFS